MKNFTLAILLVFTFFTASAQVVIMQNGTSDTCSGMFYDSGGATSNYGDNENFEYTICPDTVDGSIQIGFTVFNTQGSFGGDPGDVLTIYDGDSTAAPVISSHAGGSAASFPGTITATPGNTSGCLTFVFVSNGSGNASGWAASIDCLVPCQTITASVDATNPVADANGDIIIADGDTVTFDGSAIFSDDGTGATYSWNFGDATAPATGQSVSHIFNGPGSYTVTLTATDTNPTGCNGQATITVIIPSPYIDVNTTLYTVEELIVDVLVNSDCAGVTNVTSVTGTNYGSVNGIGYFSSTGGNFGFDSGIVLSSGSAVLAEDSESGTQSEGSFAWVGDADLENAIPGLNVGDTNNASYIQFDFVPLADEISFDFIFASDEYGTFQCTFTDAFAFLLTDQSTGITTNLAIVPGTSDVVSVLTVRDNAHNGGCPSVNPTFFEAYYGATGLPTASSPIDFRGHTRFMTATSAVIPNNVYTIKLVIADDGDTDFDAAVFLKADSFDLGGDLGSDVTIVAGTAECPGTPVTLDTGIPTAVHAWYLDGVLIPGETSSIYDATVAGEYTVEIVFSGSCQATDTVIVEFLPEPSIANVIDLTECNDGSGSVIFDLTANDSEALGTQDPTQFNITYYENQTDATAGTNVILDPVNYVGIDGQVMYIRIEDATSGTCVDTEMFTLNFLNVTYNLAPDMVVCDDVSNDGTEPFNLESQNATILGAQPNTEFTVTYYTTFADATAGSNALVSDYNNVVNPEPIYVRVESIASPSCFIASPTPAFNLIIDPRDDATFTMQATCNGGLVDSFVTAGGTYAFNPLPTDAATIDPATGEVLGGTSSATYTIEYTTTGICPSTSTFNLTVLSVDDPTITMTPTCDGGIVDTEAVPGGTYALNPVPTDGAVIDAVTGTVSGGQPNTAYSVEYTTNGACPATAIYNLTSYPLPTVVVPTVLGVCDDATPDGFTEIDLSIKNNEISGGNPNYAVTYYLNQADADAQVNPLPIPYTNISNPQIIIAVVQDFTTSCSDSTPLTIQVEDAPVAFTPANLEYCDPDSDGYGVFTLTDAEAEINGGDNTLVVTYHETLADSENDVNAMISPYNNIEPNTQMIYVRIESPTISTNCASYVDFMLIVNPTPEIIDPTPLEVCDDNDDGFAIFDLPTKNTEILNGLDPALYTVTFYQSLANAEAPINAIASPNAYVNTSVDMQTLWVRVEDNATGCFSITTLDLIVNPLPVLVQPTPLTLCDYVTPNDGAEPFTLEDANAEILAGLTGITLTYHLTQVGADNDTDEIFSPYVNTSNAQTIYIRAENNVTGCISTITLDLRVTPTPSPIANPNPLEVCDNDNDGYALFDIYSQTPIILNGETGVTITYHETLANAEAGTSPLANFYNNVVADLQTIYVRAENTGVSPTPGTGCYTIVELDLVVLPSPVVPLDIPDYVICDTDANGFAQFDFDTEITPQVYGAQLPTDFILTYHVSQLDADSGNNPIVNTANYTNVTTPQQTIFVRLVSNTNSCVSTGLFIIEVALPPVLNPTYDNTLSQCDDLDADYHEDNDGFTAFDLTVENPEIVNGNPSWIVDYYTSLADAQGETNVITDPTNFINTVMGPQTLFVRVTDDDTGCFSFTTVTIRVLNNPSPGVDPSDLILCDDTATGDMIEVFDLTVNEAYIINGENASNPIHLSYYTDQDDAITGTNAIVDPTQHSNEDPANAGVAINPQTIYVRVTNGDDVTGLNGTGCYSLEDFDIIVNPLPEVVPVEDYIICELNNDGFAQFDFSTMTAEILNGQDPAIFTVTYHETLVEAEQAINALTTLYTNTSNPQEIFVNILNTVTSCDIATVSFNIEVQEAAQANPDLVPIVYEICDDEMDFDGDPTNNSAQFDLATQDEFVLDGQDPVSYTVSYYDNQTDADAGTNALPFLYENTVNPQVIIVRVDNDTMVDDGTGTGTMIDSSQCYETAELTLQVNMLPSFDLDDTYLLCVNTNGSEVINVPLIETGLDATQYTFEWSYNGTVLPTETQPSITPTQGGTYSVTVTDVTTSSTTQCTGTDSALVEESEPPVLTTEVTTLAFANEHAIEATATGSGISVYEFSIDGGAWETGVLNADGSYSYTFTNVSAGEHEITARDANGCGESSETVLVMDYPLYFTPNDDGYHDTWNIYGIDSQPDAQIFIFDRFGKLLKQLSPTGAGWDGTYNGNPMPTSDYWFTVDYREPGTDNKKSFKAHFTLKR